MGPVPGGRHPLRQWFIPDLQAPSLVVNRGLLMEPLAEMRWHKRGPARQSPMSRIKF